MNELKLWTVDARQYENAEQYAEVGRRYFVSARSMEAAVILVAKEIEDDICVPATEINDAELFVMPDCEEVLSG